MYLSLYEPDYPNKMPDASFIPGLLLLAIVVSETL